MLTRIATLSVFALSLCMGASDSQLNLDKAAVVAGTQLKAGAYRIHVDGGKAVLKNSKVSVEAPVTVETSGTKFAKTTACCLKADGTYDLKEVRVGGTNQKLLFKEKNTSEAGH
ncbi:MAG: hypothetical protein HY820_05700 [Acidobacteria bacterium]|nr:hypothetical protein [Acidobacteriota bacterium]